VWALYIRRIKGMKPYENRKRTKKRTEKQVDGLRIDI
jgi:hypothetical protein